MQAGLSSLSSFIPTKDIRIHMHICICMHKVVNEPACHHALFPIYHHGRTALSRVFRWWRSKKRNSSAPTGSPPTPFSAALHTSSSAELKRRLLITLLEVLFFYYPSLLTTTLSLFACFHLDPAGAAAHQYHHAQVSAVVYPDS